MTSHTNPNQLLEHLLAGIDEWEKAKTGSVGEQMAAERVTAVAAALDHHMRHGGPLPDAWLHTVPDGSGSNTDQLRLAYEHAQNNRMDLVPTEMYRTAFVMAFRALHDKTQEIARLKAELDAYQGREVIYGMERYIQSEISDGALPEKPVGSIARATDTGREWERTETGWQVRQPYHGRHE
jgi:hypothetical protein